MLKSLHLPPFRDREDPSFDTFEVIHLIWSDNTPPQDKRQDLPGWPNIGLLSWERLQRRQPVSWLCKRSPWRAHKRHIKPHSLAPPCLLTSAMQGLTPALQHCNSSCTAWVQEWTVFDLPSFPWLLVQLLLKPYLRGELPITLHLRICTFASFKNINLWNWD